MWQARMVLASAQRILSRLQGYVDVFQEVITLILPPDNNLPLINPVVGEFVRRVSIYHGQAGRLHHAHIPRPPVSVQNGGIGESSQARAGEGSHSGNSLF